MEALQDLSNQLGKTLGMLSRLGPHISRAGMSVTCGQDPTWQHGAAQRDTSPNKKGDSFTHGMNIQGDPLDTMAKDGVGNK